MCNIIESKMVARLSKTLAIECGICSNNAHKIGIAAFFHDTGKIFVDRSILQKPGPLSPLEKEQVKSHTIYGAKMLKIIPGELGKIAQNMAYWHHERFDSGGYWNKFTSELPPYVSLISLADVFVALVSEREYKRSWPVSEALDYIADKSGSHFDPKLVKLFISLIKNDTDIQTFFPAGYLSGAKGGASLAGRC